MNRTEQRAEKLADRLSDKVNSNPIPYGEVAEITTTAYQDDTISLQVRYDDGSYTVHIFEPKARAWNMAFESMQLIDKACTEIRKQRQTFAP
jgi:hypothetical protein